MKTIMFLYSRVEGGRGREGPESGGRLKPSWRGGWGVDGVLHEGIWASLREIGGGGGTVETAGEKRAGGGGAAETAGEKRAGGGGAAEMVGEKRAGGASRCCARTSIIKGSSMMSIRRE